MYKTKVVIGAQWGDEGKGKVSDYLAQKADLVVRYQGGNNAGHTIEFGGNKYALKHIPSGVFNPKTTNIMAQGMVINPKMLLDEIAELKSKGISDFKLLISDRAHVILPYHLDLDGAIEELKGPIKKIGTTKKGIGPCYEDKYARIGIRYGDFINEDVFLEKLEDTLLIKNKVLKAFDLKTYTAKEIFEEYKEYAAILKERVVETGSLLAKEIESGKSVVFEGAQGVMLCIDNGTYPFVTSSSPTASAIPLYAGLSNKHVTSTIGIVKAYTTRVGVGALPTEIHEASINDDICERGREYGTVTGRRRRIGWLDTVVLKHSARVSGFTELTMTLLDVLDNRETIKIGYAYELDGKEIDYIPGSNTEYDRVDVKYIEMPGWNEDITKVKKYEDLPKNTKAYIEKVEELVGVPVKIFSVGPDREQTIEIK
ncbi:adenylosuccinate synthase [Mycoplasma marinum]|uniref:Adenylosuccinate synthetase n=1 Tax=Mycoplasma marinum TaxID=1937190 RepID=A0A4R0XW28_9MOLU|nr:adenylosuccinate synthase [Mycoplasma marinum]TCG12017.1 adenylosuccinate synthase [Mycoplasma marinum]